ncbi:MAG: hypothetical protein KF912_04280 [Phycisphaeraceae bacterium]|nr:hypothetical protein [Phycisphaeraceae bacterium]MBX3366514.1 hypothetical protein [Phycisphaeraceae bacterium]
MNRRLTIVSSVVALSALTGSAHASSPYATQWLTYNAGSNPALNYTDPASALGRPSRFTGDNAEFLYPSAVTAFNGAFNYDQVVSIGTGGHIVLGFDTPVRDNPNNPFGIDILIFGNTSFIDADYPNGIVGGIFSEGGVVELSADGLHWVTATGVVPDGTIPTIGYSDLTDPFALTRGSVPSNFRLPVDPSIDFAGMNYTQVLDAYNGSGGGTGIDIGAYGLSVVNYVRISNPFGTSAIEIDALSRVAAIPAPGSLTLILAASFVAPRRRRS